jgi:hypothetical protein
VCLDRKEAGRATGDEEGPEAECEECSVASREIDATKGYSTRTVGQTRRHRFKDLGNISTLVLFSSILFPFLPPDQLICIVMQHVLFLSSIARVKNDWQAP